MSEHVPESWPPALIRPFVGEMSTAARPAAATGRVSVVAVPTAHPDLAVRPYLLTGGRAVPTGKPFEIEAQLVTTADGELALTRYRLEQRDILLLCRGPQSVAEVAARLGLHLGVARILVGDLLVEGHLAARRPYVGLHRNVAIIERVIHGLQAIA